MKTAAPIVHIEPLFLDRSAAAAYLAISESQLEALVAREQAPRPRRLSSRRVAWLTSELRSWGQDRPISDILPPENGGHGRAGLPA